MKNKQLFMQINRCTGCQLCVMACSLNRSGSCGENGSNIHILTHPDIDVFLPVIKNDCLDADCRGECIVVCSPCVLKIADGELKIRLELSDKWQPVVLESTRRKEQ